MGQYKAALVVGAPSQADLDLPRDDIDDPLVFDQAYEVEEATGMKFATGNARDFWLGFIVHDEDQVYDQPVVDVAALFGGTSTLSPRLIKATEAWERLRAIEPKLPAGRLLLVGDYEVA